MKAEKVTGIIGKQGGGKGGAAEIIVKKFGGIRLTTSDILKKVLDNLFLEYSRDNLSKLALSLKKAFGDEVLMKAMLKEVEQAKEELVVVDGIRMKGDMAPFEKEYGKNFKSIYVTADPQTRYERSKKRGEKKQEAGQSYKSFLSKEKTGTEKDVPLLGKKASFRIDNNGSKKELEKEIIKTINKI